MTYARPDALVSTQWLEEHLSAPDIRVVDASYHLDASRDAREEFEECHIPGAVHFDIDEIADISVPLHHTMPPSEVFSSKVRRLGLGDGVHIVAYDSNGGFMAAARVWWMFRVFGHDNVSVLDGGLPKWLREGRATSDRSEAPGPRHFTARTNTTLLRTAADVLGNIESGRDQLVDARSAGRFAGQDPEPRPVPRQGHVPGSLNLPFMDLYDPRELTLLPADRLAERFKDAGVDLSKPIAATCGSGVTACVVALAAYLLGKQDVAVYDGSWAEWGHLDHVPIDTGAAPTA